MKSIRFALIAAGIVLSASSYSQTTDSTTTEAQASSDSTTTIQPATTTTTTTPSQPMVTPNSGAHYIAVLGNYTSSPATSKTEKNVTITGDEKNPGKIWIEGLTSSKIYALRKQVAGTYKIPAQKADDKSISEGTVVYDEDSKQVNICVGCKYKDESPSDVFSSMESSASSTGTSKSASTKKGTTTAKVISFTGTKTDGGTALR
ncbi:MAG: hypothetical protein H7Y03_06995 [Chitinophagaceae bacterium]|nr:hypothetical protein [Chitinophagaceae bacterium]